MIIQILKLCTMRDIYLNDYEIEFIFIRVVINYSNELKCKI